MKKLSALLYSILLVTALCGCEEEDSPLMFNTVVNTKPQNLKIEYFSPDPSCQPRSYHVYANRLGGELRIKCSNAQNIYFDMNDYSRVKYGTTASGEVDRNTLIYEDGNWSVSLIDNNSLKFVFQESPENPDLDFIIENDFVKVCANDKNKVLETSISVFRDLSSETPAH